MLIVHIFTQWQNKSFDLPINTINALKMTEYDIYLKVSEQICSLNYMVNNVNNNVNYYILNILSSLSLSVINMLLAARASFTSREN